MALIATPSPAPAAGTLFRPTFLTPDFAHYGGLAFRLGSPAGGPAQYLVTAHSIFGPAADLDIQMTSADISRIVVAAVGVSCDYDRSLVVARKYVPTPDARPADKHGAEKDVAAFLINEGPSTPPLVLDPAPVLVGDPIWINVKYAGTNATGMVSGVVAWVSEKEIRYLLNDQAVDLRGTTGAPVISERGKVVGIHLGTFRTKLGRTFGFATPGSALLILLGPKGAIPPELSRQPWRSE